MNEHGIKIDPKKMGQGELHEILAPVRDEIASQGKKNGFTHWKQNENYDGHEQQTEYLFDPEAISEVNKKTTHSVPYKWNETGEEGSGDYEAYDPEDAARLAKEEWGNDIDIDHQRISKNN